MKKKKTIIFFRGTGTKKKKKSPPSPQKKNTQRNGVVHLVAIFFITVYICNLNFTFPSIIIYLSQNNNVKATLYLNNYLIYKNFVVEFTQSKQECI